VITPITTIKPEIITSKVELSHGYLTLKSAVDTDSTVFTPSLEMTLIWNWSPLFNQTEGTYSDRKSNHINQWSEDILGLPGT
jgi:hypothetical protein